MYSVINVDVSVKSRDFLTSTVSYGSGFQNSKRIDYFQSSIIRGSSTVNGDSAHSNGKLEQEHNYVSFYVYGINIKYDVDFNEPGQYYEGSSCYVILFKFPYEDDQDIRDKLITNRIDGMILYSHPESVLCYDIFKFGRNKRSVSRFLKCNKPFIVRPNDYVGIFYYFPQSLSGNQVYIVNSTAKVIFKPY